MLKKLIPVLIGGASYIAPHAIGNWAAKQIQVPRRKLKGKNQLPEPDAFWQLDQGCVRLWGSSEQPVALLIHGWEGHHSQLHSIGSALLRKGFDVVMVDPPAHGDAAGDRASPQHFADTLKAVEKLVGPIQLLIGHSMGGLAATLAINQGLAVPYLVTVSTPADAGSTITGVADWLPVYAQGNRSFRGNPDCRGRYAYYVGLFPRRDADYPRSRRSLCSCPSCTANQEKLSTRRAVSDGGAGALASSSRQRVARENSTLCGR